MKDATLAVHAGRENRQAGDPPLPGPIFAGHFVAPEGAEQPYVYGRHGNPTFRAYEDALARIEGGTAVAFGSGMAAIDAVLGSTLEPGDALVMPGDGYYAGRLLAQSYARLRGIRVHLVDAAQPFDPGVLEGARLLWIETPSNPHLHVVDIADRARHARDRGVLVAVDNSTATAMSTRPLELGADFSVSSDSKGTTGHGDLILGHVAAADHARYRALRDWRDLHGALPGPMEVFLAHRSLATLQLRVERSSFNAERIALFLTSRPDVADVRYPGLPSSATLQTALRQMRYFGPVVSFDSGSAERGRRLLSSLCVITEATRFGAVMTTAERRGRWGADDVTDGFIRLSAGCEDISDLILDLETALDGSLRAS